MSMRTQVWVALVVVAVSAASAWADTPPPAGYVETCTTAKRQTTTSECLECRAWVSQRNRCTTMLVPYCYTSVCRSYGASAWTEVLCRTKDPTAPVVPSDTLTLLNSGGNAPLDAGVAVAPDTCAPYTPPPDPSPTKDNGSACSVSSEKSAIRALGPLTLILAGLALVALRRRSRR
jgi:hypothetical protein